MRFTLQINSEAKARAVSGFPEAKAIVLGLYPTAVLKLKAKMVNPTARTIVQDLVFLVNDRAVAKCTVETLSSLDYVTFCREANFPLE